MTAGGRRSIFWFVADARCSAYGVMWATYIWHCSTRRRADIAVLTYHCKNGEYPSVGARHPPALRLERAIHSLFGADGGRIARHAALARSRFLGCPPSARQAEAGAKDRALRVSARRRRRAAPDSGRPSARGHHRAGPFPLHRQWGTRGSTRAATRLCAQGRRSAYGGGVDRGRGKACGSHLWRQHGRIFLCLRLGHGGRIAGHSPASRRVSAGTDGGA